MKVRNVEEDNSKQKLRQEAVNNAVKLLRNNFTAFNVEPNSNIIAALQKISKIKNTTREFSENDIDLLSMSLLGTRQHLVNNLNAVTTIALDTTIPAWNTGMPEIINDLQSFVVSLIDKTAFELRNAVSAYLVMPFNKNVGKPSITPNKSASFIQQVNGVSTTPHVGPLPTEK